MNDLIEWAEKAGLENLRFRLQNAETLAKEASTTLTILLAGIGGTLAFVAKGLSQPSLNPLTIGAIVLALWLMLTGCLLVIFCMLTTSLPTPTNEPSNLYQKEFTLEQLREVELKNIQERIAQTKTRNHRVAAWLDRTRLLALASPAIFLVTAAFSWAVR